MSPSSKTCKFEKIEMMILIIGTGKKSKIGASLDNIKLSNELVSTKLLIFLMLCADKRKLIVIKYNSASRYPLI